MRRPSWLGCVGPPLQTSLVGGGRGREGLAWFWGLLKEEKKLREVGGLDCRSSVGPSRAERLLAPAALPGSVGVRLGSPCGWSAFSRFSRTQDRPRGGCWSHRTLSSDRPPGSPAA